ncbi:MAG: ATP-binding protein [Bulleidia sp.]|nr:ATP-binding protein [Bulleidia sp.]
MFIGREKELEELREQLKTSKKTAVLVYGKRRIGKSTLISEAARSFQGIVIDFECVKSTYAGNMVLLSKNISDTLGLPVLQFAGLMDIFSFLGTRKEQILVILDEYQYLKETSRKNEIDSYMQSVIDHLPENVKVILCGSYVTVMKELLEEGNPLFGRFTSIIHLQEMNYLTASHFFPEENVQKKLEIYAVFGGSPYVLSVIQPDQSIAWNIQKYLLPSTGTLRTYIENVMLKEIQKAYDIRILEIIGNGRKKYSDINTALGGNDSGLLDKQLKNLLNMETIQKEFPINKPNGRQKQFYSISDNLMRFYFAYVFGNSSSLSFLGPEMYYKEKISPSVLEFISRRFEDIARQYFSIQAHAGKRTGILDVGTFWYDDPVHRKSGEFDCVLKREKEYDFYECKYFTKPMKKEQCDEKAKQIHQISAALHPHTIGFVCSSGFAFDTDEYELITGNDLFTE